MPISNGSLNLASLDSRLVDALRDTSVASATRYTLLKDAYSRIWYKLPWTFTHQITTATACSGVADYILDGQISEVAAIFNQTQKKSIVMNKGIFMYFDSYNDDSHGGPVYNLIDIYEDGADQRILFQETPSGAGQGHGDILQIFSCKHITHIVSAGTTATGNMNLTSDYPSFKPQFHAIIIKEALMEAIKNRRDFQEMYQLAKAERDEMLTDMKRHYLTPKRNNTLRTYR